MRLSIAASRKGYRDIVDLLLSHGASPTMEGAFGTPPQVIYFFSTIPFAAAQTLFVQQVAGQFHQDEIVRMLAALSRTTEETNLWSLPPVRSGNGSSLTYLY